VLYARWITLTVFLVWLGFVLLKEKTPIREKIKYIIPFVEGMVGGLIIDSIGVNAGFYHFSRQPLYSMSYFVIVIPCWGVFGLMVNYMWKYIGKEKFLRGTALTIPLFMFYEGYNLFTNSWIYTTPIHFVALGWFPLIWTFAGCNRRRKVVFKMEAWMRDYRENRLVYGFLYASKIFIIVVMFPLMLASLLRLITDFKYIRKSEIGFTQYAKELLMG